MSANRLLPKAVSALVVGLCLLSTQVLYAAIEIGDCDQLQAIGTSAEYPLDGDYILVEDIPCGDRPFTPIGYDPRTATTTSFTGSMDGAGHTIFNLTIAYKEDDNIGLFSTVSGPNANVQ